MCIRHQEQGNAHSATYNFLWFPLSTQYRGDQSELPCTDYLQQLGQGAYSTLPSAYLKRMVCILEFHPTYDGMLIASAHFLKSSLQRACHTEDVLPLLDLGLE